MSALGTAALALAQKGMRIFPCKERSKEPAIKDNLRHATTDPNIGHIRVEALQRASWYFGVECANAELVVSKIV